MSKLDPTPLRTAWAHEKAKLGQLKRNIMEVVGISTDVQFYDFINGARKTPLSDEQQKKIAELFGKPVKTLFPPTGHYFE